MKSIFALLFAFFISAISYSQTFSYTFEGNLDFASIAKLEIQCSKIQGVFRTKIKLKEGTNKGVLIFELDPALKEKRAEADNHFAPTDVKSFLIESNLSPLSFTKIKD